MANLVIGYGDRVAGGTVTASSQLASLPAIHLLDAHLSPKVWRGTANTAQLIFDFGAAVAIGALALLGTNMTAAGTVRVRLSAASNLGSPTYDTGAAPVPAGVDPRYRHLIHLLPAPAVGRYLGLDLTDVTLAYLQAGRGWAGTVWRPTRNYQFNAVKGWNDTTRAAVAESGQIWLERGVTTRTRKFRLQAITQAEAEGVLEDWAPTARREDVLVVFNPDSANLGRDSIFGLITDGLEAEHGGPRRHGLSLRITERV